MNINDPRLRGVCNRGSFFYVTKMNLHLIEQSVYYMNLFGMTNLSRDTARYFLLPYIPFKISGFLIDKCRLLW